MAHRTNLDALGAEKISCRHLASSHRSSVVQQVAYYFFQLRYHVCFQELVSVTNFAEQSPFWEAVSFPANQEILHNLWNPKVHYRTQKNLPLNPILSHLRSVKHFIGYLFKTVFNNIPYLSQGFKVVSFPPGLPTETPHAVLVSPICDTCFAHLILLDLRTRSIFGE